MSDGTCKHPDRDVPQLVCGHPLPCPYHTATIHIQNDPPTIEIPVTAEEALTRSARGLLADVAEVLRETPGGDHDVGHPGRDE